MDDDHAQLLRRFRLVEIAVKVVGVGSVGTRCLIALMHGRDEDDVLFLQVKEAEHSVLAPYAGASSYEHQGERVVDRPAAHAGCERPVPGMDDRPVRQPLLRAPAARHEGLGRRSTACHPRR